jgi:hypothetical protein
MLISVHIPKTAGKSFKRSLEEEFGNALIYDYCDNPVRMRGRDIIKRAVGLVYPKINSSTKIIHGHMNPDKYINYKYIQNKLFVTFLRDPIATLESYYFYTREKQSFQHPIHRKIASITLTEFLKSEFAINYYAKYIGGGGIARFDFVGITENYQASIDLFNVRYGTNLQCYHENARSRKDEDLERIRGSFLKLHSLNYQIYKDAQAKYKQLCIFHEIA